MINYLQTVDVKILSFINNKLHHRTLDKIMPLITALGNGGIVWLAMSLYFISNVNYRAQGYMIIAALTLTTIIGEGIIKHIIRRTRPLINMLERKLLISKPLTYSFPSGHAASSFAAAGIFIAMDNKLSVLVLILASLIAFSRIYLNVHYPTDVLIGAVLGLICSKIVITMYHSEIIGNLYFLYNK